MALRRVNLSTDVYFVCFNHAMCTEGEEIVGLLVGEVDEERVAHVVAVLILRRSDKRKDRVEISPEQLSNASTEAEKLACILKRPVRVVGWYHSHPKLTVYPSLVDVCTQESYQLMDEGFIGMIFSVFNADPNKFGGRAQMICYQSQTVLIDCNVEKSHVEIPIQLVPSSNISDVCMNSVIQLPRFLCQEEQLAYQMANQVPLDYLTRLHNSSVYLRKMGQIAEVTCGPLLKMLEERIVNNEMKRKRLQERKKALTSIIEKIHAENTKKEQERKEKTKKERSLPENTKMEQVKKKTQFGLQDLDDLEEQELRAALLKDQEIRAKARQGQQDKESRLVKNQEMQTESHFEQTQVKPHFSEKKEVVQLGDQEVPQLKEQGVSVTKVQEMQELEDQEWKIEIDEQDRQTTQEMQEKTVIKKQKVGQDHKMAILKGQENIDFPMQIVKDETSLKQEKFQNDNIKEQTMAPIEQLAVKNKIQFKQQEMKQIISKSQLDISKERKVLTATEMPTIPSQVIIKSSKQKKDSIKLTTNKVSDVVHESGSNKDHNC